MPVKQELKTKLHEIREQLCQNIHETKQNRENNFLKEKSKDYSDGYERGFRESIGLLAQYLPERNKQDWKDENTGRLVGCIFIEIHEEYLADNEVKLQHDIVCIFGSKPYGAPTIQEDRYGVYCELLNNNNLIQLDEKVELFYFTWWPRISAKRAKRLAPQLFKHPWVKERYEKYGEVQPHGGYQWELGDDEEAEIQYKVKKESLGTEQ